MSPKSKGQTDKGAKALDSAIKKLEAKGVDPSKLSGAGAVARQGRIGNA